MQTDNVNVDNDAALLPLQTASAGELPAQPFTPPSGSTFVSTISGQSGNIVLGGGTTGFGFTAGAGVITLTGPLTTKGDLYAFSTLGVRFGVGADDAYIVADSTQAAGLKYINASTGWNAPTGTLTRGTYAAYAGQTVSAAYVQAEVQQIDNALKTLSETVAALITDLRSQRRLKT